MTTRLNDRYIGRIGFGVNGKLLPKFLHGENYYMQSNKNLTITMNLQKNDHHNNGEFLSQENEEVITTNWAYDNFGKIAGFAVGAIVLSFSHWKFFRKMNE